MRMDTTQFEFSHGKKPRGWGHWGFDVTASDGKGGLLTETVWASGTLSQAKVQALRTFSELLVRRVVVVSVEVLP